MTLYELYKAELRKPTAGERFIAEVARVTHKSAVSVRRWLYGYTEPDELTKTVLADHFNTDINTLFPKKEA